MDEKKRTPENPDVKPQDAVVTGELDDEALEDVAGGIASVYLGGTPDLRIK